MLAELVRRRDAGGLAVSCWTVCLHNTRLGMLHPQAVTRNAFGDPNYYNLCPSNPDARAYVRALVADVTATYRPDRIELESPCFMGFAHEYHHEKDGVGLTPEDDFLLSLCFCDSCLARAPRAGRRRRAGAQAGRGNGSPRPASRPCRRGAFPDFPGGGLDTLQALAGAPRLSHVALRAGDQPGRRAARGCRSGDESPDDRPRRTAGSAAATSRPSARSATARSCAPTTCEPDGGRDAAGVGPRDARRRTSSSAPATGSSIPRCRVPRRWRPKSRRLSMPARRHQLLQLRPRSGGEAGLDSRGTRLAEKRF